jgi:hypothetical protein
MIRDATRADVIEMIGEAPKPTLRLFAYERDGELLALCGWYYHNNVGVVVTEHKEGRVTKRDVAICKRELIRRMDEAHIPFVAELGKYGDTALRHGDFVHTHDNLYLREAR